ncbi:MAG: bifunctional diaminohydroxyphosphoribosylaminopyrimidine deaminase/5-amino-6-(5-phosphoribosylamino)uracil reductase RibD [Candidatus Poseidonia sp.]|nr:bifunctional diaminohydroxyphosphoribosylaminopyrimidine deaminase/5-amino-6-(5-phosphoribosylamino)uracil reductase RibD [Poseidonia sp.]
MAEEWSDADRMFMEHALLIAERGRGKVSPNPLVGCVLVKDGVVIAEGWHDHLGGLHAEQMAIHDAEEKGHSPNGSTAYVTLEPCNHFGRTPPCTEALMWAGVSEVIIAHHDPNPTVRGDGCRALEDGGIPTRTGLMEAEAHEQMRAFMHWCTYRRPLVTVKMALDANGSVDDRAVEAQRFTSRGCLEKVHELRRDCDAVLVGVETVNRDDPQLNVRLVPAERQPLRVVIDPNQRINSSAQLVVDEGETLLMQGEFTGLSSLLHQLADREVQRILVEGGPTTVHRFLEAGLVDEVFLVHSEVIHQEPIDAGLSAKTLTDAGLTLSQEYVWGEERVEHYLRSPTSA